MTLTLAYDAQLSRVRLDATGLQYTAGFEVDTAGWEGVGGTFARSTAQFRTGVASGLITPDGVSTIARARTLLANSPAVTPGETNEFSVWVRCAVARDVDISLEYHDAGGVSIDFTIVATVSVLANTWTQLTGQRVAPVNATKCKLYVNMRSTPPASHLLYVDDVVFRPLTANVERSTDQIRWTTVRGGKSVPVVAGAFKVDDYEFTPGVLNYYRVRAETQTITPALSTAWLKSIARPWLNRAVTVTGFSDVERPARAGVFDVVGRTMPVAVSDVRGSRRYTLEVKTETPTQRRDLDLLTASGDPIFVHVPDTCDFPGMYAVIGDVGMRRGGRVHSDRRYFELPLTEVAAPGPDVVGATITCQGVLNAYATCSAVLAAHATCASLLELIGSPTDVIVP